MGLLRYKWIPHPLHRWLPITQPVFYSPPTPLTTKTGLVAGLVSQRTHLSHRVIQIPLELTHTQQ